MITIRQIVNQSLGLIAPQPVPIFILCYHGFGDTSYPHNLDVSDFAKQLKYLSSHANFVSLDDIADYRIGKKVLTYPAVAITFDDGYRSLLEIRSLIAKYNIRPTAFVLSDPKKVNRSELANNLPLLSIPEIKKLILDGWDIGLHSSTHPNLKQLDYTELKKEIALAKKNLEALLNLKIKYFAYPKGAYTDLVVKVVKQSGFKLAFSMDDNPINRNSNPFTISRIGINASHTIKEFPTLFTPLVQKVRRALK